MMMSHCQLPDKGGREAALGPLSSLAETRYILGYCLEQQGVYTPCRAGG